MLNVVLVAFTTAACGDGALIFIESWVLVNGGKDVMGDNPPPEAFWNHDIVGQGIGRVLLKQVAFTIAESGIPNVEGWLFNRERLQV